jgi:uncharacterized protein (TIGR03437 family)
MTSRIRLTLLALPIVMLDAQTLSSDPGGVLSQLTVTRFVGSGAQSIQAMTSDAAGNLYVAGTTSSPDLPMKNAAQPLIGEALTMRSTDRGLSWQKVSNPAPFPVTITPHPNDPNTLFIGSVDGIYKSSDRGQTWRHVYAWSPVQFFNPYDVCCFNIAIDPANTRQAYAYTFMASAPVRFLTSSDGGESWQARDAPPMVSVFGYSKAPLLWVDPNGSGIVALGSLLSRDHGTSWTAMKQPSTWPLSFTVPDPRHAGWIYAASSAGTAGLLSLSKDWGNTWTPRPNPTRTDDSFQQAISELHFDPDLPNTFYANALLSGLAISDDAGGTWHLTGTYVEHEALLSRQCAGGALLATSGESVVSSFDFGTTWQPAQLTHVTGLATGPGCVAYAIRQTTSDAFVAKLAPGGSEVLWSTFLGGSDRDVSAAITLDGQGNVYVAGNTASADFPTTVSRVGSQGRQNVFAVKLDPEGKLIYSVVFGGESIDAVTGLAVNAQQQTLLTGWTNSKSFPATAGAFHTQAGLSDDGFAVKLRPEGTIAYASYLPGFAPDVPSPWFLGPQKMVAVAGESSGSALLGGNSGMLYRMTPDGSNLSAVSNQPGPIYSMETDDQGNIYVAGRTTGAGSGPCDQGFYQPYLDAGDIFLTKLQPGSLQQIFSGRLAGDCQSQAGALKIGPTGEVTLGIWTARNFPMRNPVLPISNCGNGGAVISRFSADGSTIVFSSYLDMCGQAPAIALGPGGSVYAGVMRGNPAGVLRVPVAPLTGMFVQGVVNAFSGAPGFATTGMLLTITGQYLTKESIDLGLNYAPRLPTQLGGVQVLFDNTPAEMFQIAPDHLICIVPPGVKSQVNVQVAGGSQMSTPFVLPASPVNQGLLTHSFPNLPPAGSVDGNIRNADGTQNDAQHPAAPGSIVTLFATGLAGPGPISLFWNAPPPQRFELLQTLSGTARHVPGFINALYAIDFRIPDAPGPGVYLVPVPGVLTRAEIGRVGSGLGVYVQ